MQRLLTFYIIFMLALSFTLPGVVYAQDGKPKDKTLTEKHRIPDGSRIFVAPMERKLDEYITSEITKKKLPVTIVTDEKEADYIITGAALKGDTGWYKTVLGTAKDKNEGSIQVIDVRSKSMIWAGEAGDRSLLWGSWSKGSVKKVASRLVGKMKSALFWKEKKAKP
jgi:hypothetical protein